MYEVYNQILRMGIKDQFTTTLHALSSAIYKLSRVAKPERVFRGLGGRVIPQDLIGKGVVEYGSCAKDCLKVECCFGTSVGFTSGWRQGPSPSRHQRMWR